MRKRAPVQRSAGAIRIPFAAALDRCATCRGALALELVTFTARLPGEEHQLCPACAVALVERLAAHHADALSILEDAWRLPSKGEGWGE